MERMDTSMMGYEAASEAGRMKAPARAAVALFLSPQSMSLDWDRYAAPLRSGTVIEWWQRRLRSSLHARPLVVIHNDMQRRLLEPLLLEGAGVVEAAYSSATAALADLARREGLDHVVLATLATALGPVELLDEVISAHADEGLTMTRSLGLPAGVGFWVFSRELLEQLCALRLPGLPSHPGLACNKLSAASASGRMPRLPVTLRERAFDVAARYGRRGAEMPLSISLNTEEEIDIAREVLRENDEPAGLDALVLWKQVMVRRTAERMASRRVPARRAPRRPRVLYVSNASAYSGAEESLCQLVRKLDPDRFEPFAAVGLRSRFQRELEAAGAKVVAFPDGFFEPTVNNFISMGDLIEEVEPDLIHSNAVDGLPLLWNAVGRRVPFIQHVRNGEMSSYKEYVEAASAVIAVSRYLRDGVLRFSVDADRVRVVYDEVDTESFRPGCYNKLGARAKYGIKPDARVVLMIARFAENKRHDLMLDAFEIVRRRVPSAHLVLKGEVYREDRHYDLIKKRFDVMSAEGAASHIPFVDDIREVHSLADALVLCSDREGLGRCVVEAMSMGVPAVVTDTGGSHEIIEDGVSGAVVPGGDASALAEKIIRFLQDRDYSGRVAAAARRVAERQLSSDVSAASVMAIYDEALETRGVPA